MRLSPEQQAVLRLHLVPDMGPRRFQNLVARFGSATQALAAPESEVAAVEDIGPLVARRISSAAVSIDIDEEIRLAETAGARILTCAHEEYPAALRVISDPPRSCTVWDGCRTAGPRSVLSGPAGRRRTGGLSRRVFAGTWPNVV